MATTIVERVGGAAILETAALAATGWGRTTHLAGSDIQPCIQACLAGVTACEACARVSRARPERAYCVRICRDAALVCATGVSLLSRESDFHRAVCQFCIEVCRACAAECERCCDDEACRKCAEACRACVAECTRVVGQLIS